MKSSISIISIITILFLAACGGPKASYNKAGSESVAMSFGITDQRAMISDMVKKISVDESLAKLTSSSKPTMLISEVKNKSSEHIDTESITDSISTAIIKRQLFTIVNRNNIDILKKEVELNSAGLTDEATAVQIGKLWGAKYALFGNFSSIEEWITKSKKQVYYKLTLIVMDIQTGVQVWSDETEISKTIEK